MSLDGFYRNHIYSGLHNHQVLSQERTLGIFLATAPDLLGRNYEVSSVAGKADRCSGICDFKIGSHIVYNPTVPVTAKYGTMILKGSL